MRCIACYCWLLVLIACAEPEHQIATKSKRDKESGVTITKKNTQESEAKDGGVTLEPFSGFAKSSKDCYGYFAVDTNDLNNQNYLFVSSSAGKSYIKVNDRQITLKLDDKIDDASIIKEIYKGSGYMMHVIMHKTRKNEDGTWSYVGEILLLKNNQQESKPVVGKIGC